MKQIRNLLNKAVEQNIISPEQATKISDLAKNLPQAAGSAFNLTNVLYYFGGLLAIGAMTLFMNLGWELFGGYGIFFLSVCYAILGLALTHKFKENGYHVPAGICATFVICLTPLAIYGLQVGLGYWPDNATYSEYNYYVSWRWLFMEFGTLIVGVILAWIYRYPFMIMPIGVTLWYMSMDITRMIDPDSFSFELGALVSLYFGLVTLFIAFWVDIRSSKSADFAFWLYLFGVITFWMGLTCQPSGTELSRLAYFFINLVLIWIGVLLNRRVFVVFGAIGSFYYIGYLAFSLFANSYLFPVILTVLGMGIIYLGILWQKHEERLTLRMRSILPKPLKELLDARDDF